MFLIPERTNPTTESHALLMKKSRIEHVTTDDGLHHNPLPQTLSKVCKLGWRTLMLKYLIVMGLCTGESRTIFDWCRKTEKGTILGLIIAYPSVVISAIESVDPWIVLGLVCLTEIYSWWRIIIQKLICSLLFKAHYVFNRQPNPFIDFWSVILWWRDVAETAALLIINVYDEISDTDTIAFSIAY